MATKQAGEGGEEATPGSEEIPGEIVEGAGHQRDEGEGEATPSGTSSPAPSKDPVETLRAELEALRAQNARLEGRLDERQTAPKAETPKEFTRAELQQQVDAGTLSEDQRDEILDRQRTRKLKDEIRAEVQAEERSRRLQSEIQRYRTRYPSYLQAGHPDRIRAEQQYQRLVDMGFPDSASTELAALERTFGTAEPAREKTREKRERHEEIGGAGGASGDAGKGEPSWEKGLNQRQIQFYRKQLDKGIYRGTDDPRFQKHIQIAKGSDPWKLNARQKKQPGERRVQ